LGEPAPAKSKKEGLWQLRHMKRAPFTKGSWRLETQNMQISRQSLAHHPQRFAQPTALLSARHAVLSIQPVALSVGAAGEWERQETRGATRRAASSKRKSVRAIQSIGGGMSRSPQ
jgi:hypothetical protein